MYTICLGFCFTVLGYRNRKPSETNLEVRHGSKLLGTWYACSKEKLTCKLYKNLSWWRQMGIWIKRKPKASPLFFSDLIWSRGYWSLLKKVYEFFKSFAVIFYGVLWGDSWANVRDSHDSAVNLLSLSNPSDLIAVACEVAWGWCWCHFWSLVYN